MNYLFLLAGIKELVIRAFAGGPSQDEIEAKIRANPKIPSAARWQTPKILEQLAMHLGPLELRSEYQGQPIVADLDDLAAEFAVNADYLLPFTLKAAGSLLILAHETTKGRPYRDHSPLWEFLRHCRNAAAHGGEFNFMGKEPIRPANWGHIQITRSLQATPLFKGNGPAGLLSIGDPIRLLWEIEDTYRNAIA